MSQKGTIVFKKKELLIPEGYLDAVLKAMPSGVGYAYHDHSDKKPNLYVERGNGKNEVKDIMNVQNDTVDNEVLFWFTLGDHEIADEDLQPFVVLGKEVIQDGGIDPYSCHAVGFAEGDFFNYIPTGSDHSNEYFLFNKYLIPRLLRMGDDAGKMFDALRDDLNKMDIVGQLGARGNIVLLSNTGRIIPFIKNENYREFEWGWTTNNHGYTEGTAETTTKSKLGGRLQQLGRKVMGKPIASTEPVKQPDKPTPVEPPKTDTADVKRYQEIEAYTDFPQGLSNNSLKQAYKNALGYLPSNWKDRPRIKFKKKILVQGPVSDIKPKSTTIKDFKDLDKYATKVEDKDKAVTAETLPILPPKIIEAIKADFLTVDKSSRAIPDPEQIMADMKKYPSFWEQFGIKKEITDAWTDDDLKDFTTKYSAHAWVLIKSYREMLLLTEATTPATEQEPETTGETAVEPDTSGTGVVKEEPKPAPTSAPVRKFQTLKKKTAVAM